MDTLGIDENGCPVIIEYKRDRNQNVINQGLFYLDWLMDHRGDFELLVLRAFGKETADEIEWSAPRLICIAGDFTKFDEHAVNQMGRNIELIRYRQFGDDLLLLDLLTATSSGTTEPKSVLTAAGDTSARRLRTVSMALDEADEALANLYADLRDFLLGLGDDVIEKALSRYFAFRRLQNFACVEVKTMHGFLKVYLKVNPDSVALENDFTRDVRNIGHFGTGDLEVTIRNHDDLERAKPLILQSYESS
jgi:predicted transport protein